MLELATFDATLIALVSAAAKTARSARLFSPEGRGGCKSLRRRRTPSAAARRVMMTHGHLRYEDGTVAAGTRYVYRLGTSSKD